MQQAEGTWLIQLLLHALQDGRNWARIEADHHTWALFDVGEAGQWDAAYIGHPQVQSMIRN